MKIKKNRKTIEITFAIILIITAFSLLFFLKLLPDPNKEKPSAEIQIGNEIVTDEYKIRILAVNIHDPNAEEKKTFSPAEGEVIISLDWQFEPLKNQLKSSPKAMFSVYDEIESKDKITMEDTNSFSKKVSGDSLVTKQSHFIIKRELLNTYTWKLYIDSDWKVDIDTHDL